MNRLLFFILSFILLAAQTVNAQEENTSSADPSTPPQEQQGPRARAAPQAEPPPGAEAWDSDTNAPLAAWECEIGHVCFWNRPYGTGSRCMWDVADPDWLSGSIQCSWADTDNVGSVFNNSGPEGGHEWTGVVYYKEANYRGRVGCTRNFHAGNLAGTYKVRSHAWTTGRCG